MQHEHVTQQFIAPPFAARLRNLDPQPDVVTVVTGPNAIKQAEVLDAAIALPPSAWPGAIAWPVSGRRVVVLEHGEACDSRVTALAEALIHAGAREVELVRLDLIGRHYENRFFPEVLT